MTTPRDVRVRAPHETQARPAPVAHLKTLQGSEFDKEFLNMMVTGHEKEVARIDPSINTTSDQDFQTFLKSVKPMLPRHEDEARDLQKSPQASAN